MMEFSNMEKSAVDISVVIPVYGCPEALPELHRRLVETIEGMGASFEIVLVDDCCPKNSWEGIAALCALDTRVIGVRLSRNFGQIRAITAGLNTCRGRWIVVMDCDLQDRPENIASLYAKAQEGYDVVFSKRVNRKDSGSTRFLSRMFYGVYNYFTDGNYDPDINNFSICHRKVIDAYLQMPEHHRAYTMFIKWLGFRSTTIELPADPRFAGESSYSFKKKMSMAIDLITAQSDKPLKFAMGVGLVIAALAFFYLIYLVIYHALVPDVAVGWTSTVGAVFLMGGLVLATLGIMGIYIGNIFTEVKNRPLYVVMEQLNGKEE